MARIGITSWGSISALGATPSAIWEAYQTAESAISYDEKKAAYCSPTQQSLESLCAKNKYYHKLDRSVLLSLYAAEQAFQQSDWQDKQVGINIGSSRGATGLFEHYHQQFLQKKEGLSSIASPSTTLGNIASWTARHLQTEGIAFSHSLTCSTAFQSILNGIAWLRADLVDYFIAGGTEAPLTDFTIAQMNALRIYAKATNTAYPCRALDLDKRSNTMVLGEGAAVFCLEKNPKKALAWIKGIGFYTEKISHPTSISKDGICLEKSMRQALKDVPLESVDIIITHSPGTIRGDQAEWNAIQAVFGEKIPLITTNKWKIGHTLGASGALSLEMALLMIQNNRFIAIPYLKQASSNRSIQRVLINTLGFGGTAVSILIEK